MSADAVTSKGGASAGENSPRGGRLLVVDDEVLNRDLFARRLTKQGYDIKTADNGVQALALLREGDFDFVLLDIMMPEMDGYAVLEQLKADERLSSISVIVISAGDELEGVVRCLQMGAEDYLTKPFNPVLLKARIEACLDKKVLRDRERAFMKKLEAEEKHHEDLLNVVIPLGVALSGEKNLDRLFERILAEAKQLCHADGGTLYLTDEGCLKFAILSTESLGLALGGTTGKEIPFPPIPLKDPATGQPNEKNVSTYAALRGVTVNIPDVYTAEGFDFSGTKAFDARSSYRSISLLAVPLKNHEGEVIGVLQLINARDPVTGKVVAFDKDYQQVIESMASQAAVALNNHLLLERQKDLLKYERDIQIGRKIQQDFLPEELPQPPGWEIAARFRPAREVAGDFYDAFPLGKNHIGFIIADVCDKGVGAALFMALFRSLIRAYAQQHAAQISIGDHPQRRETDHLSDPGQAMKRAIELTNDYIANNHTRTNMFATLFFGVFDPESGKLVYGNGGHEPPVVIGKAGIKARFKPTSPAGGMMPGVEFKTQEFQLEAGDTLLAFTDGVPEARNPEREFFTEPRLLSLLERPVASAASLLDRIDAALADHIQDAAPFDDITMLALRRVP